MKNLVALGILALALVGCGSKPSLVGQWETDVPAGPSTMKGVFEFKADNTFAVKASGKMSNMDLAFTGSGTYELKDKDLSITTKEAKVSGLPPQYAAFADQAMEAAKKTETSTIEWKDPDTLEVSKAGKTTEFKRVKK